MRQVTIDDVKAGVEWVKKLRADGRGRWASMLKVDLYEEVLMTIRQAENEPMVFGAAVALAQTALEAANVKPPDGARRPK